MTNTNNFDQKLSVVSDLIYEADSQVDKLIEKYKTLQSDLKWLNNEHVELEDKYDKLKEALNVQAEYTKLLSDELNDTVGFASVHGWKSTRHADGVRLRAKLSKAKEEAGLK